MIEILEYTRDAEAKIAKTARVCYAKQQQANETKDAALLQNLARRKHWAPFEFADMTVKITCDRAVANAFTRHRHGSFMQQSTHYVNMVKQPPSFVCPFREDGNREAWLATIELYEQCEKTYAKLLTLGVSAAEARIVMPLGLETTLIMKANARTLLEIVGLRALHATGADHPHMVKVATRLYYEICQVWPWFQKVTEIRYAKQQ